MEEMHWARYGWMEQGASVTSSGAPPSQDLDVFSNPETLQTWWDGATKLVCHNC